MLAVVDQPHIKFSFEGAPEALMIIVEKLREAFPSIHIQKKSSQAVAATKMDWYKQAKARLTPERYLDTDRFNAGFTQKQLAEHTGILQQHLSEMESGKRTIGKTNAHKLAKALGTEASRYLSVAKTAVAEPKVKYTAKPQKRKKIPLE